MKIFGFLNDVTISIGISTRRLSMTSVAILDGKERNWGEVTNSHEEFEASKRAENQLIFSQFMSE